MTTTQTTSPQVKAHIDGGTYTVLTFANTRNGWGIAITRWTTWRNTIVFEVNRVSPDNHAFRLGHFATERQARDFANTMWKRDR